LRSLVFRGAHLFECHGTLKQDRFVSISVWIWTLLRQCSWSEMY
jgi:hypothetical protein